MSADVALLAFEDAHYRVGERDVLQGVTMDLRQGECLAVMGPSGVGKTTLARLALGLRAPTRGRVLWRGSALGAASRARMALVQQKPGLTAGTILDGVALPLRLRGMARGASRACARSALEDVGLGGLCERTGDRLSGGEERRVAFARALVSSPELLVLDEFTANLDPANGRLLEARARDYLTRGGTVLLVTHNMFQARRLATRCALMDGGQVVETAPASVFFDRPVSDAARRFLAGADAY